MFLYFPLQMVTNSPSVNLNKVFEGNKSIVVAEYATHFRLKATSTSKKKKMRLKSL